MHIYLLLKLWILYNSIGEFLPFCKPKPYSNTVKSAYKEFAYKDILVKRNWFSFPIFFLGISSIYVYKKLQLFGTDFHGSYEFLVSGFYWIEHWNFLANHIINFFPYRGDGPADRDVTSFGEDNRGDRRVGGVWGQVHGGTACDRGHPAYGVQLPALLAPERAQHTGVRQPGV